MNSSSLVVELLINLIRMLASSVVIEGFMSRIVCKFRLTDLDKSVYILICYITYII